MLRHLPRMRALCGFLLLTVFLNRPVSGQGTDPSWMPERVITGLTMQLVERFETIGGKPAANRSALIQESRDRLERLRTVVDGWNVEGVIERAPDVKRLNLSSVPDPRVEAMMRYQVCNVILMLQYEDTGRTPDARQLGALGLTAMTAVQVRLVEPYLARGGKASALEAAMTDPSMETAVARIQREPATLAYVQAACGPVAAELLGAIR